MREMLEWIHVLGPEQRNDIAVTTRCYSKIQNNIWTIAYSTINATKKQTSVWKIYLQENSPDYLSLFCLSPSLFHDAFQLLDYIVWAG